MKRLASSILIVSILGMCVFLSHSPPCNAEEVNPNSSSSSSDAPPPAQVEVLFFYAKWCGPCREMLPRVEQFRKQHPYVRLVDVDEELKEAQKFNISAVPTLVAVRRGKDFHRAVGSMRRQGIRNFFKYVQEMGKDR